MIPFDVEGCLSEIAEARRTDADGVNVQLGHAIADGFRRDFDAMLDMETVGVALAIGGVSTIALLQEHGGLSRTDLAEILALAGEKLVRTARARAAEAAEVEGVLCEHVLTWHSVDATLKPVEIPLYEHIELPNGFGELRSHTREVPPPVDETPEVPGV